MSAAGVRRPGPGRRPGRIHHPHLLRHRFATRVLQATQDLLGHASPTTMRIYAKLTDKDTRAARWAAREEGL